MACNITTKPNQNFLLLNEIPEPAKSPPAKKKKKKNQVNNQPLEWYSKFSDFLKALHIPTFN